jgi:hypothetical protein
VRIKMWSQAPRLAQSSSPNQQGETWGVGGRIHQQIYSYISGTAELSRSRSEDRDHPH